jgi:seryl-tRNA synthetase
MSDDLLQDLFADGQLLPSGVDGLYGRGPLFEAVVTRLDGLIDRMVAGDGAEIMRFPPGMPRAVLERSGYLRSFPDLAGTVHCFCGDERAHARLLGTLEAGDDWTAQTSGSDIVLTPAACYPVYPAVAARGPLPAGGTLVDVLSWCFRHEPSKDAARLQMFRMREHVRIGSAEEVRAFRDTWMDRAIGFAAALGLPAHLDLANDPFFGRGGRIMTDSQRERQLKFELLIPVNGSGKPTACMSFNYHEEHFGGTWGIRTAAGGTAHTACVGFGMERLTLAILRHHGTQPEHWPEGLRTSLHWTGT